jgi:RNA polymerase sigma factor
MLLSELKSSKQLPLKIIENNCKIPRKILERHRKYIIAAIELLHGEYPNLAEYLRYIREVNEL